MELLATKGPPKTLKSWEDVQNIKNTESINELTKWNSMVIFAYVLLHAAGVTAKRKSSTFLYIVVKKMMLEKYCWQPESPDYLSPGHLPVLSPE